MRSIRLTNHYIDALLGSHIKYSYDYLKKPPIITKYGGCCGGRLIQKIDYDRIRCHIANERDIEEILNALYADALEIKLPNNDKEIFILRIRGSSRKTTLCQIKQD